MRAFLGGNRARRSWTAGGVHRGLLSLPVVSALLLMIPDEAPARNVYVANHGSSNVSVIDSITNTAGSPIPLEPGPFFIAITPDGSRAYVTNQGSDRASVIDTATNAPVGSPIPTGTNPWGVGITPDGSRAYVPNFSSSDVSVIDTVTNANVGTIPVGNGPQVVAITPDGSRAYVAIPGGTSDRVSVIDTATNTLVGTPIPLPPDPVAIAITPDGSRVYVGNEGPDNVSLIDTATNSLVGPPIPAGSDPQGIAITPDGSRVYVTNFSSNNVSVIDTATNTVSATIPVGLGPVGIALTPDGSRAFVVNGEADSVSVIDTASNTTLGPAIPVGTDPIGVAIVPDQGPTAAFSAAPPGRDGLRGASGRRIDFNAGASSDPDGTVVRYAWDFGDGTTLPDGGPTPSHTYARDGTYTATLTVTDNEGCSTSQVFTGQTMSCNGGGRARVEQSVVVDGTAPNLKLSGQREQPLDRAVEVGARTNEATTATGKGTLLVADGKGANRDPLKAKRYKLKRATKQLPGGRKRNLKLKVPKRAGAIGRRALRRGGELTAKISVKVTDSAGNSTTKKRRIELN